MIMQFQKLAEGPFISISLYINTICVEVFSCCQASLALSRCHSDGWYIRQNQFYPRGQIGLYPNEWKSRTNVQCERGYV